jgi:AraC-like DNA-binding protein
MENKPYGGAYSEGYEGTMPDFHSHPYYEITLVLSGDVTSDLADRSIEGTGSRLVLTPPRAPHFMRLASPSHYTRINFHFYPEFLEDCIPEWRTLLHVFGQNGSILPLDEALCARFRRALEEILSETSILRARLLLLVLLSRIAECEGAIPSQCGAAPRPVVEALAYIAAHYSERIVAASLAWRLGVGRTTLLTAFHRHTGFTLCEYILRVRVREATALLAAGETEESAAARVGLGSGSSLIRAFRRVHGVTPRAYLRKQPPHPDRGT